ncbi:MAG: hypothetical protein ACI808_002064, partial [Paraglaciecola sp.]
LAKSTFKTALPHKIYKGFIIKPLNVAHYSFFAPTFLYRLNAPHKLRSRSELFTSFVFCLL